MNKKMSKPIGFLWIITSVIWVVICLFLLVWGLKGVNDLERSINTQFDSVDENIVLTKSIITETIEVFDSVNSVLATVEQTAIDTSRSLSETSPLITESTQVITQDVPDALDDLQASMPSVIETAGLVDDALKLLSAFSFSIPIPLGDSLEVGLGVAYDPSEPLDDALQNLSASLEDVPDELRGMQNDLDNANENLLYVSEDISSLAKDLNTMNEEISDIKPQLEKIYLDVEVLKISIQKVRKVAPSIIMKIKVILIGLFVLVIFSQIPYLYFGLYIIKNR